MTTLKCNLAGTIMLTQMMVRYLNELIKHNVEKWDRQTRRNFLKNVPAFNRIVQSFITQINYYFESQQHHGFDKEQVRNDVINFKFNCTTEELGLLGMVLFCNKENVWRCYEADKIPLLPEGKERIEKVIDAMYAKLNFPPPYLN